MAFSGFTTRTTFATSTAVTPSSYRHVAYTFVDSRNHWTVFMPRLPDGKKLRTYGIKLSGLELLTRMLATPLLIHPSGVHRKRYTKLTINKIGIHMKNGDCVLLPTSIFRPDTEALHWHPEVACIIFYHVQHPQAHIRQHLVCKWMTKSEFSFCGNETDLAPCNKTFNSIINLVEHVNVIHVGGLEKRLPICEWLGCSRNGKPFRAKYKLINHIRVHTGGKAVFLQLCQLRKGVC